MAQISDNGLNLNGPIASKFNKSALKVSIDFNELEESVTSVFGSKLPHVLDKINIQFSNICFSRRYGIFNRETKTIIDGISGEFRAGELTAIMGPSGAGKSTLLNILSGYWYQNVRGILAENGRQRDPADFRRKACYIMQDDKLQPLLTIQESMFVAADLKLPARMSPTDKGFKVKKILKALGLYESRKTLVKKLSGGQRKRLAVALELLRDPPVMFFDEPTSGLDSSTSKQVVELLKELACEGRTVVCTIHQPSAMLLEMFDHLYAMSEGRCVYQGGVKGMLPYLENFTGLKCPAYHNPSDFLLEVSRGEYGDVLDDLVVGSGNGVCSDWRKCVVGSSEGRFSPPPSPTDCARWTCGSELGYTTTFWSQLLILLRRSYLQQKRDISHTFLRLFAHILIGIFIGILYFGVGKDATYTLSVFNYLFFTVMFNMYTAFSSSTVYFAEEVPIVTREHFNRWYSVKSYFLAVTLADLPIQLLSTSTFVTITYYMTSQPLDSYRLLLFLLFSSLVSLVAQSFGMLISASLSLKHGVIFGPLVIMPFLIFSGFFIHLKDAHPYSKWLFKISFLYYALDGVSKAIFGYDRPKMYCGSIYCHFKNPKRFLEEIGMNSSGDLGNDIIILVSLYLLLRILTYLALLARVTGKR